MIHPSVIQYFAEPVVGSLGLRGLSGMTKRMSTEKHWKHQMTLNVTRQKGKKALKVRLDASGRAVEARGGGAMIR